MKCTPTTIKPQPTPAADKINHQATSEPAVTVVDVYREEVAESLNHILRGRLGDDYDEPAWYAVDFEASVILYFLVQDANTLMKNNPDRNSLDCWAETLERHSKTICSALSGSEPASTRDTQDWRRPTPQGMGAKYSLMMEDTRGVWLQEAALTRVEYEQLKGSLATIRPAEQLVEV